MNNFYCPLCKDVYRYYARQDIAGHFVFMHEFPAETTFQSIQERYKRIGIDIIEVDSNGMPK